MLRKAKRGEAKEVSKLLKAYWKRRKMKLQLKNGEEFIRKGRKLEVAEDNYFVFEKNKEIIGAIGIAVFHSGLAELRDIVVKDKFRGSGYGRQMLNDALDYCKAKNVRKVYGYVLYEHEGLLKTQEFYVEGVLRNHFADGEDLLIMSKFLK